MKAINRYSSAVFGLRGKENPGFVMADPVSATVLAGFAGDCFLLAIYTCIFLPLNGTFSFFAL